MKDESQIERLLDPLFYLESFTKLKGKTPGLIPFILNDAQRDLFNALNANSRVMILKARQMGFSTAVTGYLYHRTITTPGTNTALIGYNSDLTAELLDKVKTFYRTTPEAIRPKLQYNSKYEISFPAIDSKIIVLPSSENVGRGYTIHNCLHADTAVYLKDGEEKRIADVQPGDDVLNGNGGFSTVVEVTKKETSKRMLEIDVVQGGKLMLTEDHLVLTRGCKDDGFKPVWKSAGSISEADYIAIPYRQCRNRKTSVEIPMPPFSNHGGRTFFPQQNSIQITKELGIIMGWYLAEGCTGKNRVCFCVHENEVDEVSELIRTVFVGLYGGELSLRRSVGSKGVVITVHSSVLAAFFKQHLPGRAWEKTIPDEFWYWGWDFNKGLLTGLIRGDGCVKNKKQIRIVTTSKRLANQVRLMMVSLRLGVPSIYKSKCFRYGISIRDRYDICISGNVNWKMRHVLGFEKEQIDTAAARYRSSISENINLRHSRYRRGKTHYWLRIRSVVEVETPKYVYDLVLPDEPHSFMTSAGVVHNCLLTELAFWDKAEEKMLAIENAVPSNGKIIIESTPNAIGNLYHRMWMADNGYVKKKYGWWWGYTEEEIEVIRTRVNNPMKFAQEYGLEFLSSGRPVFPSDLIKKLRMGIRNVGDKVKDENGAESTVTKNEDEVIQYFPPSLDRNYVLGADVAEGVNGGDLSVITVFDRKTGDEVAFWRGYIAPEKFGALICKVGRMYNYALAVVEINNHGLTTVTAMKNLQYPTIYFRPVVKMDTMGTQFSDRMGWKTTKVTRPLMIDDLREALAEGSLKIHSEKTLDEMLTFVFDDGNNMVSQSSFHDDCIFATAIGFQGFKVMYSGKLDQIDETKYLPDSFSY